MDMLNGWKTYILVGLFLILILVEKGLGWDVAGFEPGADWLAYVLGALGIGTLRHGVKSVRGS